MVQSILSDDEEELSFSSYATARTDQLTGVTTGASVSTRTMFLSETTNTLAGGETLESDTLITGEEMFHTLQDVEDLAPDSTMASVPSLLSLPPELLATYLANYNAVMPPAQATSWCPERNLYGGHIRVEMNLERPINVISGTRPPSIYNIMSEDTINDRTLTTFYLPPGTEKALHITSQTTTQVRLRKILISEESD